MNAVRPLMLDENDDTLSQVIAKRLSTSTLVTENFDETGSKSTRQQDQV